MGKESEHLHKQHPHEAPKVMLYPAMVLAGLCIVWGLAEPLVASFMHVPLETHSTWCIFKFGNADFPGLAGTDWLNYLLYLLPRTIKLCRSIAASKNPLTTILSHGYFFDDFYGAVARGISSFSGVLGRFEDLFSLFPQRLSHIRC